jgi:AcrR family transcriptional regulator
MSRAANPGLPLRILAEAERIVAASGPAALNMRKLARKAGVTATAIYHYFAGKEDLVLQLKLRAARLLNGRIRGIDPALPARERIQRLGREYIGFAEEHPQLYRLLFETPLRGALRRQQQSLLYFTYRAARQALEQLRAEGSYPIDPRYGAMMGWTMLHGFSSLLLSGSLQLAEGLEKEELKRLFLSFYGGGTHDPGRSEGGPT